MLNSLGWRRFPKKIWPWIHNSSSWSIAGKVSIITRRYVIDLVIEISVPVTQMSIYQNFILSNMKKGKVGNYNKK